MCIRDRNLLEECGKEISRLGKRAFIIAGNRAWDAVKERMIPGFEKAGLEYELHLYGGKCSYEAAREYAEKCKAENCDEVVEMCIRDSKLPDQRQGRQ